MLAYWRYSYHSTPEGQDLSKKLFCAAKYATMTGIAAGLLDSVAVSHAPKLTQKLNLIAAYVLPMVGVSSVFVTAVYLITNYRQKDVGTTYILANIVASTVYAFARKSAEGTNVFFYTMIPLLIYKNGIRAGINNYAPKELLQAENIPLPRVFRGVPPKDYPKSYTRGYI